MSTEPLAGAACARPENQTLPWISENTSPLIRARMARVCASCPVLASCALEVATTDTTAGFWAGHDRTAPDLPEQDTLPGFELSGVAA
ncbi:WhiB family transcriptional regulator [Promicromonospora sukumoe]